MLELDESTFEKLAACVNYYNLLLERIDRQQVRIDKAPDYFFKYGYAREMEECRERLEATFRDIMRIKWSALGLANGFVIDEHALFRAPKKKLRMKLYETD